MGNLEVLNAAERLVIYRTVPRDWRNAFGYGYSPVTVTDEGDQVRLEIGAMASGGLAAPKPWWANDGITKTIRIEADIIVNSGRARGCHAFVTSGPWTSSLGPATISHEASSDLHQWLGIELDATTGSDISVLAIRRYVDGHLVSGEPTRITEAYINGVRVWPVGPAAAPSPVSGSSASPTEATVTWGDVPGAREYVIYRNGVEVGRVAAPEDSYISKGLAPQTTYAFQVAAVTSVGLGLLSDPVSVKTAMPNAPTLALTASATSAEVYFTSLTFTAKVTANPAPGTHTLQRQLPGGSWVNVGTITPGTGLAVPNAIPAGAYTISPIMGTRASFRVHFVGSGTGAGLDVYSPVVSIAMTYRSRNQSKPTVRTAPVASPKLFMDSYYPDEARIEIKLDASVVALMSSASLQVPSSTGHYCTGDVTNPYVQYFTMVSAAAQSSGAKGPVALSKGGADWVYSATTWGALSALAWRLAGQRTVKTNTQNVGVVKLVAPTLTINYVDGHPPFVIALGGTTLSTDKVLIG